MKYRWTVIWQGSSIKSAYSLGRAFLIVCQSPIHQWPWALAPTESHIQLLYLADDCLRIWRHQNEFRLLFHLNGLSSNILVQLWQRRLMWRWGFPQHAESGHWTWRAHPLDAVTSHRSEVQTFADCTKRRCAAIVESSLSNSAASPSMEISGIEARSWFTFPFNKQSPNMTK